MEVSQDVVLCDASVQYMFCDAKDFATLIIDFSSVGATSAPGQIRQRQSKPHVYAGPYRQAPNRRQSHCRASEHRTGRQVRRWSVGHERARVLKSGRRIESPAG